MTDRNVIDNAKRNTKLELTPVNEERCTLEIRAALYNTFKEGGFLNFFEHSLHPFRFFVPPFLNFIERLFSFVSSTSFHPS